LVNTPCLSKTSLQAFSEKSTCCSISSWQGLSLFMIAQPIGILINRNRIPVLHLHAQLWMISMLFHFSALLRKIALSANGIGIKPFLNQPIYSRKMFVSPCPSH
jgi:hypothetical protein